MALPPSYFAGSARMASPLVIALANLTMLTMLTMLTTSPLQAARIVTVEVSVGGRQVMGIARTDLGEAHATMWQHLKTDRMSIERWYVVPVQESDQCKAVLSGDLQLSLVYGNSKVVASAKTDQLTLVRAGPNSGDWFLDPADVDRTMQLAGLELPAPPPPGSASTRQLVSPSVYVGAVVLLLAAVLAFSIRRGKAQRN